MSLVDSGKKVLKHRLSSGGLVSTNQGCKYRNKCLQELNEDEGFFSKMGEFSHEAEGRVRKEAMQH